VDESFDPQGLLAEAKGQKVILNLKGITRLSSFGVREWTNAMRQLCTRIEHVYLVEVSAAVVTQLNMVANFAGTAQVLSVQTPFYCDCGYETEVTHDLRGGDTSLPEVKCPQCKSPMSFDDDPEAYFQYPLESARSKPLDPNIDVFLKHLSDSFQETAEPAPGGSKITQLPVPSVIPHQASSPPASAQHATADLSRASQDLSRAAPRRRTGTAWVNARSVMLGLSIPAVLAIAIAALWRGGEAGSGLSDEAKQEYLDHFNGKRFGEAALLVRRLERQQKIDAETSRKLKDEIRSAAVGPFAETLEQERFVDAAKLVTNAARDRVLSPKDSTRMHKEVMDRAQARHRELLAAQQFSAAEAIAEGLGQKDVLPTALRRSFQNDVTIDRQQVAETLQRKAREHFEAERWKEALETAKLVARLGPLDADMTYVMAETYRRLDKVEEAAVHYANFIGMVENESPPHANLDGALYWRAKYLASAGRDREAKELFQRVIDLPNSQYRSMSAQELK
jgi:tetratricopeptide (TPR) repeat protein